MADCGIDEGFHLPAAGTAADTVQKVLKDFIAHKGMLHFWVKLRGIQAFFRILHGCAGTAAAFRCDLEPVRDMSN